MSEDDVIQELQVHDHRWALRQLAAGHIVIDPYDPYYMCAGQDGVLYSFAEGEWIQQHNADGTPMTLADLAVYWDDDPEVYEHATFSTTAYVERPPWMK